MLNQILFWGGMSLFITTSWVLRKLQAEIDERFLSSEEEEKEEVPAKNCACC